MTYTESCIKFQRFIRIRRWPLLREAVGEFFGTFILVLLGDGCIAQGVLGHEIGHHEHGGFVLITFGWGFAVMMGVYFSSRISKGIINPAVAIGFGLVGRLNCCQVIVYCIVEVLGAFFGAALLYLVYYERLMTYAASLQVEGGPLLTINGTGGIFCTWPEVSNGGAFFDQVVGTALLAGGALAIVDKGRLTIPDWFHAPLLAFLVACIVGAFALNAGAPLNPARDLGPRIFIALAGWGKAAFTDNDYYFWVPIFGPILGAIIGSYMYVIFIGAHQIIDNDEEETKIKKIKKEKKKKDSKTPDDEEPLDAETPVDEEAVPLTEEIPMIEESPSDEKEKAAEIPPV